LAASLSPFGLLLALFIEGAMQENARWCDVTPHEKMHPNATS